MVRNKSIECASRDDMLIIEREGTPDVLKLMVEVQEQFFAGTGSGYHCNPAH